MTREPRSRPDFALQFDAREIDALALRYSYGISEEHIAGVTGPAVRARGWYTKAEFDEVCYWKSPRSASRAALNRSSAVEEVSRVALSAKTEELRIWAFQALDFVSWPTASVFLHFGHTQRYPILDFRALHALGVRRPTVYSMAFWLSYLDFTRQLATESRVDMRTLDRALWQWSKEQGVDGDRDDV